MVKKDWAFHVEKSLMKARYDVYGAIHLDSGEAVVRLPAKPLYETVKEGELATGVPFLTLTYTEATALMDALWFAGARPSTKEAQPGELAATKAHLDDMRKIAFDFLGSAK